LDKKKGGVAIERIRIFQKGHGRTGNIQPHHGLQNHAPNHDPNDGRKQNQEPNVEKVQKLPTPDTRKGPATRAKSTSDSSAARTTLTLTIKPPKIGAELTIKTKRIK
jgi:hypothetical protein